MIRSQVNGTGRFYDSICPICASVRGQRVWLKPLVKAEYYSLGKLIGLLRIPWPCISREKQTGKKPWE
jgi:hypothetical protein